MIIIGIIAIIAAIVLFVWYSRSKTRLEEISSVETSTLGSLQEICRGVAEEIGSGSFDQKVEVKGIIECDQPLESELAKEPCVHYTMTVQRKWEEDYEETYTEKDSQTGEMVQKTRQGTRQGSDTVSRNARSTTFTVRDDTGTILVDPDGAEIDTEQVVDRFEPQTAVSGGKISFGSFSFSLGNMAPDTGRRRTLGYHFREHILPLQRPVYILGAASDRSGQLMVQKPSESGKYLISLKSEEELVASAKTGMTWGLYGAIGCGILGILFIILHFI
jgi:hypothetical protein